MVPKMSASCEELDRMVYGQLGPKFPCWKGSMSDNRFNPLLYILEEFRLSYEQVSYIKAVHEALYACKYRRFAGRAMRADGVYQVFSGWKHEPEIPSDTREECIRKFINYMDTLLPFPAIIQERLEEARQYYHRTEPLPGDYIEPLGDNKRCRDMHHKIISVRKRMVPCWAYEHIVDEKTQSMIESQTKSSKAMVELGFVCHYGLNAGPAMRKAGLFEEITDWYVPNDTREQCMNKAKNYFSSLVPFADDLQAFIKESRDYYHLDETLPGYRAPPESDSCKKLRDAVYIEINDTVPCWKFEHIIDQDQAWDELFDRSKDFKRVREALEVCSEGHNAGVTLKQDRLVLDDILSSDD